MQQTLHSWKSITRFSLVVLVGLLATAPSFASTKTAISDDEGPALKITADWLTANLVHMNADFVKIHTPVADGSKASHKPGAQELSKINSTVTSAAIQGCHLSITEQVTTTIGSSIATKTTVYEVPLENMKSVYLGVSERPTVKGAGFNDDFMPNAGRVVHINSLRPVIAFSTTTTGGATNAASSSDSGMTAVLDILGDDASLSQRVEKALNHAVHLCSATLKPEPF
jgi:hypothetical protein